MTQTVLGLREKKWRTAVVGFKQRTTVVNYRGTRNVVCVKRKMTMLGRPTNAVGSICGLQMESDSNELQNENDSGGIQT